MRRDPVSKEVEGENTLLKVVLGPANSLTHMDMHTHTYPHHTHINAPIYMNVL